MSIESIVRPFESPQPFAQQRTAKVVAGGTAPAPAVLIWGAAGAPIPDTDPYGDFSVNVQCCDDKFEQQTKKTETVKVQARDENGHLIDGSFVTFQRPVELAFVKMTNECSTKAPDIVAAPIANLFTPDGQPVYAVTDNTAKESCHQTFTYKYDDDASATPATP